MINHAPIVSRFFGELMSGAIEGIRPMAALSRDVHELYVEWARRAELPPTSLAWLCRYLGYRYGIHLVRKMYADGAFVRGPRSIMLLRGPHDFICANKTSGQPIMRMFAAEELGEQILEFRHDVRRYIARGILPAPETPLREHLP